jgi:hypothetical protein
MSATKTLLHGHIFCDIGGGADVLQRLLNRTASDSGLLAFSRGRSCGHDEMS